MRISKFIFTEGGEERLFYKIYITRLYYFNCEHFLVVQIENTKKLTDLKKIVDFQNLDHPKTFPGVMWGSTQNLGPIGSAVLTFIRYKQTDTHPDRHAHRHV